MLAFIWALIIGGIAGAIAKWIMPGREPGGIIVTILLGIAGSEVATFLGRALGWYRGDQSARRIPGQHDTVRGEPAGQHVTVGV